MHSLCFDYIVFYNKKWIFILNEENIEKDNNVSLTLSLCPTFLQILYASGKVYMIFFVMISFWFAFYMTSLFLGILTMTYEKEKQRACEESGGLDPKCQQTVKELDEENDAAEV